MVIEHVSGGVADRMVKRTNEVLGSNLKEK